MHNTTTRKSQPPSAENVTSEDRKLPLSGLNPKALLSMSAGELQKSQSTFGYGDELGFIKIPKHLWSTRWHESDSYVDLRQVLAGHGSSDEDRDLAVRTLVRWFLICLSVATTTSSARRSILLAPTTVYSRLTGLLIPLAKAALQEPPRDDGTLFGRLKKSNFEVVDDGRSRRFGLEFRRLEYLARRGLWLDEPTDDRTVGHEEPSNKGPARKLKSPPKIQEWKPLPDALTHAAGWRSAWIIEHLAPVLLDVFEQTIALRRGFSVTSSYIPGNRFVLSYAWHIPGVAKGEALPFQVNDMTWPPTNTAELLVWLKLVQQANSFVSGLSAGPRASETLSWRTDCLVEARDGITVAKGRTFKIVAPVDGAATDWPLPKVAVLAIHQQVRLSLLLTRLAVKIEVEQKVPKARVSVHWQPIAQRMREQNLTRHGLNTLCGIRGIDKWENGVTPLVENVMKVADKLEIPLAALIKDPAALAYAEARLVSQVPGDPVGPQPLWRVFGGKGKGNALSGTYNDDFRDYIKTLGLLHITDDQKLVYHRFRKTIARVVALCYAHAPQILMDIFGHHDIDMTLHYILADPTILADINAIQRELKVMKACELIENVDSCGGAGAKRLQHAVSQFKIGKEDFGTEDVYEAAVLWTLDGRTWDFMGQGRYCLKGPLDKAPCAKMHSVANKAKCNKKCDHRLVSPEGIRDSDEAISGAVINLEQAWATDDYMMATQWSGQILAKIDDHEQLFVKWKDHLTVARVLSEAAEAARIAASV